MIAEQAAAKDKQDAIAAAQAEKKSNRMQPLHKLLPMRKKTSQRNNVRRQQKRSALRSNVRMPPGLTNIRQIKLPECKRLSSFVG